MSSSMPTLRTDDDVALEAQLDGPADAAVGAVLCHPHPQYGGSMHSIVISELFRALPAAGVRCLRFNFRGVGRSAGAFDDGRGERLDVLAAIDGLPSQRPAPSPLGLTGWSSGADVARSVIDPRVGGWMAIAPPLRFATALDEVAADARPKLLALAERDEFRVPAEVQAQVGAWRATRVEIVPGASHFFVGRTDRVVELARGFCTTLTGATDGPPES